jgi:hypothetical protein
MELESESEWVYTTNHSNADLDDQRRDVSLGGPFGLEFLGWCLVGS